MVTWADHNARMRRFLRDPDRNIWSDSLLYRLFNDAQAELSQKTPILESVAAMPVPPQYACAYMHDWEYEYAVRAFGQNVYQCWHFHQQSGMVCAHRWEMEILDGGGGQSYDAGWAFTNPWEAWYGEANVNIPIPLPRDFRAARLMAWDEESLEPVHLNAIQNETSEWIQETGDPRCYWRNDGENYIHIFPLPDDPAWNDSTGAGMALFSDSDDPGAETGIVTRWPEYTSPRDTGITTDAISTADNLFAIYTVEPLRLTGGETEETSWPEWAGKYVENFALASAYLANTDGQIDSLHQYWAMRAKLGVEVLKKVQSSKLRDMDIRFSTHSPYSMRNRRGPHLPDTYPAV